MKTTTLNILLATALAVMTSHGQQEPKPKKTPESRAPVEAKKEAEPARGAPKPQERGFEAETKKRPERKEEPKARSAPPSKPASKPDHREGKPTPFVGIAMEPVPPPLRWHFDIDEGFGVMVAMVMDDSPAAKAGIKAHDLVLKVDDQRVVNMEQVKALISSGKKGDSVKLTIISKGQEKTVDVTLDERVMPVAAHEPIRREGHGGRPMNGEHDWRRPDGHGNEEGPHMQAWRGMMEHFQDRMREYQEAIRDWHQGDRSKPMPTPPMFQGRPMGEGRAQGPGQGDRDRMHQPERRDGDRPGEFRRPPMESPPARREGDHGGSRKTSSEARSESTGTTTTNATVSRRDDSGEYLLVKHGRGSVFTVRPKDGHEQSWDLSSKEARASIPPQFREKLEMLEGIRVDSSR